MVLFGKEPAVEIRRAAWGEFVALPENRSALQAIRRLALDLRERSSRGRGPTPLVLHGGSGTGKSLLVQTLVTKLAEQAPESTARVISARDLTNDDDDWFDLVRCDLLVIEDLHHLPVRVAELVSRLIDERTARRRPTLVTANSGPAGMKRYPRRLTSRLAAGLVIALEPLAPKSRQVLVARYARLHKVRLTDDAVAWLVSRVPGGIRPLFGQVERLKLLGKEIVGAIDADTARDLLREKDLPPERRTERILARVASAFGVTPREIVGPRRHRTVLIPRQVAMWLAREIARLSFPQIGAIFHRNHATVMHACETLQTTLRSDAGLRRLVKELKTELT